LNSSWTVRVNRDDLLEIQVDGTDGSAVAGLRDYKTQHHANTPKPEWNPDTPTEHDFYDDWTSVPNNQTFENAFKRQWEMFIRHVVEDEPFPWDFRAGVKGVQLTEASHQSWKEGRRVSVDELTI
ncbi:Gfo/Idh/MocA family oxidoreductase, partial [Haladaptatus sp.]|uniref:Gfo/Idh/MocA family oxidoreductase n=1 Tax=Haladaptatus sp. TaxID=1973141 RepID=UPI003C693FF7